MQSTNVGSLLAFISLLFFFSVEIVRMSHYELLLESRVELRKGYSYIRNGEQKKKIGFLSYDHRALFHHLLITYVFDQMYCALLSLI